MTSTCIRSNYRMHPLANADIPRLALLNHFFHFFPGNIGIFCEVEINIPSIAFERNGPIDPELRICIVAEGEESVPMHKIEVDVVCSQRI